MGNLRCFRIDKNVFDRTDKYIIAQPKMNLESFKGVPDSLKWRFKESERKQSLGAPDICQIMVTGILSYTINL